MITDARQKRIILVLNAKVTTHEPINSICNNVSVNEKNERDGESKSSRAWEDWSGASNVNKKSGDVLIADWQKPDLWVKMQDENVNDSDQ